MVSSLLLKATADPRRAIDININASLEFLKRVMPDVYSQWNRVDEEGLLDVPIKGQEDKGRLAHRPNDKWIGKRLKIDHELRMRLKPRIPSKLKTTRGESDEGVPRTDEIWMHVNPEHLSKKDIQQEVELVLNEAHDTI